MDIFGIEALALFSTLFIIRICTEHLCARHQFYTGNTLVHKPNMVLALMETEGSGGDRHYIHLSREKGVRHREL